MHSLPLQSILASIIRSDHQSAFLRAFNSEIAFLPSVFALEMIRFCHKFSSTSALILGIEIYSRPAPLLQQRHSSPDRIPVGAKGADVVTEVADIVVRAHLAVKLERGEKCDSQVRKPTPNFPSVRITSQAKQPRLANIISLSGSDSKFAFTSIPWDVMGVHAKLFGANPVSDPRAPVWHVL